MYYVSNLLIILRYLLKKTSKPKTPKDILSPIGKRKPHTNRYTHNKGNSMQKDNVYVTKYI